MDEFWKSWLSFWFLAGPLLLSLAHIIYNLYLIYFHLEAIKEALKNSRFVYIWGHTLGKKNLLWTYLGLARITGMVLMPKIHIRAGVLDPIEFESFPPDLKRLLKIYMWMMCVASIWLVIAAVLVKLR